MVTCNFDQQTNFGYAFLRFGAMLLGELVWKITGYSYDIVSGRHWHHHLDSFECATLKGLLKNSSTYVIWSHSVKLSVEAAFIVVSSSLLQSFIALGKNECLKVLRRVLGRL